MILNKRTIELINKVLRLAGNLIRFRYGDQSIENLDIISNDRSCIYNFYRYDKKLLIK